MSGYKGGRILKIKVKDFMTYDDLEIIPKKGLNIIIGLNGSGKSSLMSAICLGLAGKPQFTGRSTQLSDFIKHGKQKAVIEIELDDPDGNVVICRIIEGDKSTWRLNRMPVSQAAVLDKISKYNIDMGNLCQFLPQEKVSDFSKMDKKQRLEVIIQAIGEPSLHTLFNDLKKIRTDVCNVENDLKKCGNNKNLQVQQKDRLKVEVDKHEERIKLQEELETFKLQKTFYEYKNYKFQFKELKKEKKKMGLEISKIKDVLQELESELNGISSSCWERSDKIRSACGKSTKITESICNIHSRLTEIHEQVDSAKIHYQTRIEDRSNQLLKLDDLKMQIRAYQKLDAENAPKKKDIEKNIAQNTAELEKVREEIGAIESVIEDLKLKINGLEFQNRSYMNRIAALQNEQNNQMRFLKQRFPHTYEAVCWLEENKSSFKSTICLPPLLSLKVSRDEDRKYIENIVPLKDLNLFVCTDEDDLKRLTDVLYVQKKLTVNIGLAPKNGISAYRTAIITESLRSMGVERYASDLFTAPEPVMCYLCALSHLHQIPICSDISSQFSEEILKRFKIFFTTNERFSCKRSRYGAKNTIMRKDYISGKNFIQSGRNENNYQELRELGAKIDETKQQIKNLTDQSKTYENKRSIHEKTQERLREQKRNYAEVYKDVFNVVAMLKKKTELYEKKKTEVVDTTVEKDRLNSMACLANTERMIIAQTIKKLGLDLLELKLQNVKDIMCVKYLNSKRSSLKSEISTKKLSFQELEEKLRAKELKSSEVVSKVEELRNYLKASAHSYSVLEELHSHCSIEEVEQKIINIQARLDLNYEDNELILQEYQNLQLSINEISSRIEVYELRLELLKADMEIKKQKWLPAMENYIKTINKNFSKYYKFLKCAGEISLETGDDPDDFAEYGLQIRLKHRDNESFSVLSPDHHSGGERNVASIVFILSLQELTTVPFRCVDEINQGMDSTNERKMYEFIAADASKTGSCSQYFLLTPKLLKNLSYHIDVAVHIIFNSKFLETQLNVKKHLEIVGTN